MANRININGIELTREQTFPTVAETKKVVIEETVKEEVVEEKVEEPTVEEIGVIEETTDEVADDPKDEE